MRLAELAERTLREMPGWEVVSPARLGVVCFRRVRPEASPEEADDLHARLVGELFRDGFAFLSSTRLRERTVLRMCTINPRTTDGDIRETLERLERLERLAGETAGGGTA